MTEISLNSLLGDGPGCALSEKELEVPSGTGFMGRDGSKFLSPQTDETSLVIQASLRRIIRTSRYNSLRHKINRGIA